MNIITHQIALDLKKPGLQPVVHAVQGEANTRCVEIKMLEDGTPWNIPEDVFLAVRYGRVTLIGGYYDTLPDGTPACSYNGNTIRILLAPQMMTEAGAVFVQVEMLSQEQMLATFSFQLKVELNPALGVTQPENYVNWLKWMEKQLDLHVEEMVNTGMFEGPTGPQGAPASITGQKVDYQASVSKTTIPAGTWNEAVPAVAQGNYLWTRTTITFNSGTPVVTYSVSRMGMDGAGSVSSVANVSPEANGNVPLTAGDIGALSASGGAMTGELQMNGQSISGLSTPTTKDQAANMDYVNQQVRKAVPRNILDNSDFSNPVNQRGRISYNYAEYSIDRWKVADNATPNVVLVNDGYITISAEAGMAWVSQYFEKKLLKEGDNFTVGIWLQDGSVLVGCATIPQAGNYVDITMHDSFQVRLSQNAFELLLWSGTKDIKYIAFYEGIYTVDTIPEYQPKGYGAELMECQRYLQRVRTADLRKSYCEDFRPTMRMTPQGIVSHFDQIVDGITYYFASAEL